MSGEDGHSRFFPKFYVALETRAIWASPTTPDSIYPNFPDLFLSNPNRSQL